MKTIAILIGLTAATLAAAPAAAGPGPRFAALVDSARRVTRTTAPAALRARLEVGADFYLIDVREDSEWASGAVPSAIHLSRGVLEREIEGVVPGLRSEIVLYCAGGPRSILAAESLQRMGYSNVLALEGGYRAWLASGSSVAGREAAR